MNLCFKNGRVCLVTVCQIREYKVITLNIIS